jgi:hypothetical protein
VRPAVRRDRWPAEGGLTTATADKAVTAGSETLIPASSRESLLDCEQHQIDLLVPAGVPLNKLADLTREAIRNRPRSIGAVESPAGAPWHQFFVVGPVQEIRVRCPRVLGRVPAPPGPLRQPRRRVPPGRR